MAKFFGYFAGAGFVVALLVHLAALFGLDFIGETPAVFALHVLMFVPFFPCAIAINKQFGHRAKLREIAATLPKWAVRTMILLMIYASLNFILFIRATDGGSPSERDGQLVLQQKGKLIRVINEAEYRAYKTNEIRGMSGHWLLFYFMPFAYFRFGKKAAPDPAQPE